jgi:uncharacterized phage-associated protein
MLPTYSALAVANYFLDLAKAKGSSLDPMKLQKMIFFAHGWSLALYDGEKLIDEPIQAWQYGPVVQSVYHEFKSFGGSRIDSLATDIDMASGEVITPRIPLSDEKRVALLNKIWDIYGNYSGLQLSHLTHLPGSAWSKTRAENPDVRFAVIKDELIKEEFDAKLQQQPA